MFAPWISSEKDHNPVILTDNNRSFCRALSPFPGRHRLTYSVSGHRNKYKSYSRPSHNGAWSFSRSAEKGSR